MPLCHCLRFGTRVIAFPSGSILEPLARHSHELTVIDELDFLFGDNHEGGMADMLTAGGATSFDQHVARAIGGNHRFESLTLGVQTSAWGGNVQTRMSYRDGTMVTPDDDPLVLWLQGGPGGSSVGMGGFGELGPLRLDSRSGTNTSATARFHSMLILSFFIKRSCMIFSARKLSRRCTNVTDLQILAR